MFSKQCCAIFLTADPSENECVRLIRAENKRTQLCLLIELAEEKSQSLHSQKPPNWAQEIYFRKEINRYFEWHEKVSVWMQAPKSVHFDKLKPEPGQNPARLKTLCRRDCIQLLLQAIWRVAGQGSVVCVL